MTVSSKMSEGAVAQVKQQTLEYTKSEASAGGQKDEIDELSESNGLCAGLDEEQCAALLD